MALDTARRRKSAIYVALPFRSILPVPDGNIETEDRYNLAGQYSGLVGSVPQFSGPIPNVLVVVDTSTHAFDLGAYFSGPTEYALSPTAEVGWTFDTGTGLLTIDTDDDGSFGPYVVTGTNATGSAVSNAFLVTVAPVPMGTMVAPLSALFANTPVNRRL